MNFNFGIKKKTGISVKKKKDFYAVYIPKNIILHENKLKNWIREINGVFYKNKNQFLEIHIKEFIKPSFLYYYYYNFIK